eukprot:898651-Prymnesium_polylepis.1
MRAVLFAARACDPATPAHLAIGQLEAERLARAHDGDRVGMSVEQVGAGKHDEASWRRIARQAV